MSPYILKERREEVLSGSPMKNVGELNFRLTSIILDYLKKPGLTVDTTGNVGIGTINLRYTDYNEIVGVLECIKQEFYRRVVAPYEDKKKDENGDVF